MNEETQKPAIELPSLGSFIAGAWQQTGAAAISVLDKFTQAVLAEVPESEPPSISRAIAALGDGFQHYPLEPVERGRILRRTAELLGKHQARLISIMMAEAGFTAEDALTEVRRSILTLELCAAEAVRLVGQMVPMQSSPGHHRRIGFTLRVPIGVVCAITPFNSPLNTVCHKVGPALAAGNVVVLKPSNFTPLSAAVLVELLLEAGLPPAHIALVYGGASVGETLLANQHIQFFAFTGSTAVGRRIRAGAGLRRCQLELGSIASTIVCADADFDHAVAKVAAAAFRKAGQVCTSVQKLFVQRTCYDEIVTRLTQTARRMPAGDPRLPDSKVGPMITEQAAVRAEASIKEAVAAGADLRGGGDRRASVLTPTVLANVPSGVRVMTQEAFAPLLCVIPFDDLPTAINEANATPYGLGAGLFTRNIDTALNTAMRLRFGSVHINETSSARADAMPFGGVKDSGSGQEGPYYATREMTEERLVTLNL